MKSKGAIKSNFEIYFRHSGLFDNNQKKVFSGFNGSFEAYSRYYRKTSRKIRGPQVLKGGADRP